MKLLAVVAVVAVLFVVAGGKVELRWWTASGASNIPAAKDAARLVDTASVARLDASFENFAASVNGINVKTPAGEDVLVYQVPGIAARLAEKSENLRVRVSRTHVDTPTGRQLREVIARALLAQRIMYADLARGAASRRTARAAFAQWVRRYNRLVPWLWKHLESVVAQAPPEDRAAVAAALNHS